MKTLVLSLLFLPEILLAGLTVTGGGGPSAPSQIVLPPNRILIGGSNGRATGADVLGNVSVTLTGTDALFQAAIRSGATLWVDGTNGDDVTALPGRLDMPYRTITAAKAAAQSTDTIDVRPGIYDEGDLLSGQARHLNFEPGAVVEFSGTGFIFSDASGPWAGSISGAGKFVFIGSGPAFGVFSITQGSSEPHVQFDEIDCDPALPVQGEAAISVTNAAFASFTGNAIRCNVADGIGYSGGLLDVHCPFIAVTGTGACALRMTDTGDDGKIWIQGSHLQADSDEYVINTYDSGPRTNVIYVNELAILGCQQWNVGYQYAFMKSQFMAPQRDNGQQTMNPNFIYFQNASTQTTVNCDQANASQDTGDSGPPVTILELDGGQLEWTGGHISPGPSSNAPVISEFNANGPNLFLNLSSIENKDAPAFDMEGGQCLFMVKLVEMDDGGGGGSDAIKVPSGSGADLYFCGGGPYIWDTTGTHHSLFGGGNAGDGEILTGPFTSNVPIATDGTQVAPAIGQFQTAMTGIVWLNGNGTPRAASIGNALTLSGSTLAVATGTTASTAAAGNDPRIVNAPAITGTGSASIDFGTLSAGGISEQNLACAGANPGDRVDVGTPSAPAAGLTVMGYVLKSGTVTLRASAVAAATGTAQNWSVTTHNP